jgi:hypothetical protein
VHARDDTQLGDAVVRDLLRRERTRDDADDLAARGERGVGEDAHQPDPPSAVHEADPSRGEDRAERARGIGVRGTRARVRPAEDAEPRTACAQSGGRARCQPVAR